MSRRPQNRERWTEARASAPPEMLRAGALLREGDPARLLRPGARERVRARLSQPEPVRSARRGGLPTPRVVGLTMLLAGPLALAAVTGWTPRTVLQALRAWEEPRPSSPRPDRPSTAVDRPAPAQGPTDAPRKPTLHSEAPPPTAERAHADVAVSRLRPPLPPARPVEETPPIPARLPPPVPPASGLLEEARLLGAALEELRGKADAERALTLLDELERSYPGGELADEALLARIDALLSLERTAEVDKLLAPLSEAALSRLPRGSELRLLRAELGSERGRCAEALRALEQLRLGPGDEEKAERALRTRAFCRLRSGGRAAAEQDLREYLQRFPQGAAADEARELLER